MKSNLFECEVCSKTFIRKHNLKSHLLVHTKVKNFKCKHCDKRFSRSHDLKRHENIHSSEDRVKCESCSRSFSRNDALARHQRRFSGTCGPNRAESNSPTDTTSGESSSSAVSHSMVSAAEFESQQLSRCLMELQRLNFINVNLTQRTASLEMEIAYLLNLSPFIAQSTDSLGYYF